MGKKNKPTVVSKDDADTVGDVRDDSRVEKVPQASSCFQNLLGYVLVGCNWALRIYCGLYMIISDCDETYNYWEPLNLIFRGFGKQTWEYSPAYAIRSYAYLLPYYISMFPLRDFEFLTSIKLPAYYYFYGLRIFALGGFTAYTEYKLFRSVSRNYNQKVANWFLLFTTFAPGMSLASIALLPSSFAMSWVTWGSASALTATTRVNDGSVVRPSIHAFTCFVVAGLVGWPFALALAVPFGLFTIKARYQTAPLVKIVLSCSGIVVVVFACILGIDSYFYSRKLLFVPINIVLYNVFALEGEGPEIFGTEPFSYYVKNLFLNFNVVAVLGYMGALINTVWGSQKLRSAFGVSAPLIIWTVVFGRQPHKEERFLYPIYTLISLSAAILTFTSFDTATRKLNSKFLVRFVMFLSMCFYVVLSVLRILNLVENYSAPLITAQALHNDSLDFDRLGDDRFKNVCVGREWYHFPTSFFLPDNYRLRFVKSGFDGLLPGDFPENTSIKTAASTYPSGMNSKNQFSEDKVIPFSDCHYYIDNSLPGHENEPRVVSRNNGDLVINPEWRVLKCQEIINPDGTHRGIGKLLYVPNVLKPMVSYEVGKMDYCVLKRN